MSISPTLLCENHMKYNKRKRPFYHMSRSNIEGPDQPTYSCSPIKTCVCFVVFFSHVVYCMHAYIAHCTLHITCISNNLQIHSFVSLSRNQMAPVCQLLKSRHPCWSGLGREILLSALLQFQLLTLRYK